MTILTPIGSILRQSQQRKRGSLRFHDSIQLPALAALGNHVIAYSISELSSPREIQDMISKGTVATIGTREFTGEKVHLLVAIGKTGPLAPSPEDNSVHLDIHERSIHIVPLSCPVSVGRNELLESIDDEKFLIYRSAVGAINRSLAKSMPEKGLELLQSLRDREEMDLFTASVYVKLVMDQNKELMKKGSSSAQTIILAPGVAFVVENFTVASRVGLTRALYSDNILTLQSLVTVVRDTPEDAMQACLRMYSTAPLSQMTIQIMVALGGLDREPVLPAAL